MARHRDRSVTSRCYERQKSRDPHDALHYSRDHRPMVSSGARGGAHVTRLTASGIRYVYIGYHDIHDRGRERAVRMSATSSSSDPNWGAMVHAWGGSEPDSRVVLNGRGCRDARTRVITRQH